MNELNNLNIDRVSELPAPIDIKRDYPVTAEIGETVRKGRQKITSIMTGKDKRLMVIVGPCSIHSYDLALDYANKLKELQKSLPNFLIVMRVYFEKPRTTVGWKGLINDPKLNGTYHIHEGLVQARKLLLEIASLGLPTATEFLDPIVPQYISDLVSWAAIGARTTESQTHREMASGLSMPVGFKNSTDGSIDVALNAIESSRSPQNFLGINQEGKTSIFSTLGNTLGHLVLRGGGGKTNYEAPCVQEAIKKMNGRSINPVVVIDCSHANSSKDHNRQSIVLQNVIEQIQNKENVIHGVMLESNIEAGNQAITADLNELKYGVSVTDKCIDWSTTVEILAEAHKKYPQA
jgi:3-deoxy-7-phosphoheptulonate synthase